jgi:alpha-D-ribose 1-methylphosphonate 5-phosphate C-P lyase
MLGTKSIYEESYGAIPEYEYTPPFCDKCGLDFSDMDVYIEKWDGKLRCADCIEEMTYEGVLDYIGISDIFDVLDRLNKLEYTG